MNCVVLLLDNIIAFKFETNYQNHLNYQSNFDCLWPNNFRLTWRTWEKWPIMKDLAIQLPHIWLFSSDMYIVFRIAKIISIYINNGTLTCLSSWCKENSMGRGWYFMHTLKSPALGGISNLPVKFRTVWYVFLEPNFSNM